jgi:hypothetical protein
MSQVEPQPPAEAPVSEPATPEAEDAPFYIGYEPEMPARLATFVRRVVPGVCAASLLASATIAAGHRVVEAGVFEFGRTRTVTGTIVERPYPAIRVGGGQPDVLLVSPGKFGAAGAVRSLEGRAVRLSGSRIARDGHEMLEVASVADHASASSAAHPDAPGAVGQVVTLRGEIVDSKCFLGVMAPGSGRTHRACASLCLRGGMPPALHVQDLQGRSRLLLLTTVEGDPIDPQTSAAWAAEPIEITGTTGMRGGWRVLATDPVTWRRLR